jgi:replicative DNA helicase
MEKSKLDNQFFEIVIAYHLLTNEEYLGCVVDSLDPRFFKNKDIRCIVDIIIEFFNTRGTAPTLTEIKSYLSTDKLKESYKLVVGQFKDVDKKYNVDELFTNTEKFLKENAVYHTMLDVVDEYENKKIDTSSILDKFEKACSITLSGDLGLDYFAHIDTHIDDLEKEERYISSNWEWLDRKLNGGFLETGRSLYLFAGATNVGKSIFLGNIACNVAAQGKTVVLISLEMSELMYAKRVSSKLTRLPINDLTNSSVQVKESIVGYKTTHPKSKLIIKEFPPNAVTARQVGTYLKKLNNKGIKPDMVVLDYINLLHCPLGNNSYERVKHAAEQVRALTYEFSCPIVTATQINRAGINEQNPGVENISESIGLAATADCIMNIWQDEGDVDLGVIRMGMVKNRYGQNFGTCTMAIDYTTLALSQTQEIINTEEAVEIDQAFAGLQED